MDELRLFGIGSINTRVRWGTSPGAHTFHELILVMEGEFRVRIDTVIYDGAPGDAFWYPPGVEHEEWTVAPHRLVTIFFAFDLPSGDVAAHRHCADAAGRMSAMARWIFAERAGFPERSGALVNPLFRAMLAEYRRLGDTEGQDAAARVRAHITEHLTGTITLDELALVAGLSRYHFVRQYRHWTGRTPMADVRAIRLQAARDLVITTDWPLKVIAPKVGLGDEYQLAKLFRKTFGVPPGRLRARPVAP